MFKPVRHLALLLIVFAVLLTPSLATQTHAQGLPPAFGDAVTDLGKRLGIPLTLRDFDAKGDSWVWKPVSWKDNALECPKPGQTAIAGDTMGYEFIFGFNGKTYDYRVSFADRKSLILCINGVGTVAGLAAVRGPGCTLAPRLIVGKAGIVLPG